MHLFHIIWRLHVAQLKQSKHNTFAIITGFKFGQTTVGILKNKNLSTFLVKLVDKGSVSVQAS